MAQPAEKRETKTVQIKDGAFKWDDPLDLESELTEEERMVRDTARDYAQEKLFPRVLKASATRASIRRSCAKWARWAFSARRCRKNMAAPGSATSPTA